METTQSVIELVADAQAKAKASEQRVAEIETLIAEQGASEDASEEISELLSSTSIRFLNRACSAILSAGRFRES